MKIKKNKRERKGKELGEEERLDEGEGCRRGKGGGGRKACLCLRVHVCAGLCTCLSIDRRM